MKKYTALKQASEYSDPYALTKAFEALGERYDVLPEAAPKELTAIINQNLATYLDWFYGNPTGKYIGDDWRIAPWTAEEKEKWNAAYRTALTALEEAEKVTAGQEAYKPTPATPDQKPIPIEETAITAKVPLWWLLIPAAFLASIVAYWLTTRRKTSEPPFLPIPATAGYGYEDEDELGDCGCDGDDGLEGLEGYPKEHLAAAEHKLTQTREALKIASNQIGTERCETVLGTLMEIQGGLDVIGYNLFEVLEDPESSENEKEIAERLDKFELRSAIRERDIIRSDFVNVCLKKRHGKRSAAK